MNTPKMIATLMLFLVFTGGSINLVRDMIHLRDWMRVGPFFDNRVTRRLRRAIKMDALVTIVGSTGMLGMIVSTLL